LPAFRVYILKKKHLIKHLFSGFIAINYMEDINKRYWKGIEELSNDLEFVKIAEKEFPHDIPADLSNGNNRRDFLKLFGFSIAAASLAACETPVKKAIPYLNKPENLDPSIPNYYASTYFEGGDYCSVLVKTREGRPIKIEGNNLSAISKGKSSMRAQASVLSLYDTTRFKSAMKKDQEATWEEVDKAIKAKLAGANNIRIVASSIISPSTKSVLADFMKKYPSTKLVMYDSNSMSGIMQANKASFGSEMIPSYDFSKAEVIVSLGADFLGTWLSPTEFARQYAQNKKLSKDKKEMVRHYQFESRLSLTGANADYRGAVKPSQEQALVAILYKKLNGEAAKHKEEHIEKLLDKAAKELQAKAGKALVVSGSNDPAVQTVVNAINTKLGAYGGIIDTTTPIYTYQGNDAAMDNFIEDVKAGSVDAVIFYNTNPVYNHSKGKDLKTALSKVGLKVSMAETPDETSVLCDFVCPDNHYLESWGDAEPKKGHYSITQPTITPLFTTRQAQESFLVWTDSNVNYYDYLRGFWKKTLFPTQNKYKSFDDFWNNTLHDGIYETKNAVKVAEVKKEDQKPEEVKDKPKPVVAGGIETALASIAQNYKESDIELSVYQKMSLGNGSQANNPWLQEMPDPISKACWDNYLSISQAMAKSLDLVDGNVVSVSVGGASYELPVLVQPGQAKGSVAVAVGYGREVSGKVGKGIGVNVFALAGKEYHSGVKISKTDKNIEIAQTQTHHTIMGRAIIQESTLKEYKEKPNAGRVYPHVATPIGIKKPYDITLWKGHKFPNHSWGLVVDLNSCIGCGACSIACQAENNVPVVGKKEVLMRREMHWIRIDRYYSSVGQGEDASYKDLEIAAENPEVTFMPMMCQHCNNAPCETVCPVLATTHSTEGLNQMAYNRCIGTRYCANNCPFKVRRFNWFHYAEDTRFTDQNWSQTTDLGRMVLNPDVTVRSRGVMEKCTMCVQRIQAGKLEAKKEKRHVKDGDFTVACAQSCPTDAIVFGDMNDVGSLISKTLGIKKETKKGEHGHPDEVEFSINEPRAYHVLEEINVKPQVSYLTKIRNKDEGKSKGKDTSHEAH
jgi:MoCo/4Fe-4S cofactor protein with predicted Tat translocation signal